MSFDFAVNSKNLKKELDWLESCIKHRISSFNDSEEPSAVFPGAPTLDEKGSPYAEFIIGNKLNEAERLVLILALSQYLNPSILNAVYEKAPIRAAFKVFGSSNGVSVLPTAETAMYILSGQEFDQRLLLYYIFETEHTFYKQSVLELGEIGTSEHGLNAFLAVSSTFRDQLIFGNFKKPRFSEDFAAHLLTTKLEWDDLVLAEHTRSRIEEAKSYLDYYELISTDPQLKKQVSRGCRILFYGDSGTGKTASAALMGKYLNRDVYRVDISTISSKYIGESAKRLNSLFNMAESKGWIIFLDEGDALLGQRSQSGEGGANSHYANQDVAFLLQRIENYDGIIIVATNLRTNIDQAFTRRFQSMVRFQPLNENLQMDLWLKTLSEKYPLEKDVDLMLLIKRYTLPPASIINVIIRATMLTMKAQETAIKRDRLEMCIKDEELKYKG